MAFKNIEIGIRLQGFPFEKCFYYVLVWIALLFVASAFPPSFLFFFFAFSATMVDPFSGEQCIYALFMVPQTPLFINFFTKNGSHNTIHTFKNYFATVFSLFSFQFQQNKFYPNKPLLFFSLVAKIYILLFCYMGLCCSVLPTRNIYLSLNELSLVSRGLDCKSCIHLGKIIQILVLWQ